MENTIHKTATPDDVSSRLSLPKRFKKEYFYELHKYTYLGSISNYLKCGAKLKNKAVLPQRGTS